MPFSSAGYDLRADTPPYADAADITDATLMPRLLMPLMAYASRAATLLLRHYDT